MALRVDFKKTKKGFEGELEAKNCYVSVMAITASKIKAEVVMSIKNKKDGTLLDTFLFEFSPSFDDSDNYMQMAYKEAKKLPEFFGATDC